MSLLHRRELGEADRVERLEVTWPDGASQEARVDGVDLKLVVEQDG